LRPHETTVRAREATRFIIIVVDFHIIPIQVAAEQASAKKPWNDLTATRVGLPPSNVGTAAPTLPQRTTCAGVTGASYMYDEWHP
jgi:hypothetical protein